MLPTPATDRGVTPEPSIELSDVGATSLVTLYARARESRSTDPILSDPVAVELTQKLDPLLGASPLHRQLARGKVDRRLAAYVAMRARHFDIYSRGFVKRHPDGYIVNLGCGFDTRFHRIDDGSVRVFDLDRAEVIRAKRQLLPERERYEFVEGSVLEGEWMEKLPEAGVPALFLAEGLFMYLPDSEVKSLVLRLKGRFPGSELIAEVFNTRWLNNSFLKWLIDLKLRKRFCFGKEATFRSGLAGSRDMERWGLGIEFVDDWYALDEGEPKLGVARWLRRFELCRTIQWVVHYRLGAI